MSHQNKGRTGNIFVDVDSSFDRDVWYVFALLDACLSFLAIILTFCFVICFCLFDKVS